MSFVSSRRIIRLASVSVRNAASFAKHNHAGANAPYIQHYRNTWPETVNTLPQHVPEPELPPRTVPDSVLRFELTGRFDTGASIFYPHMNSHPADFKVALKVSIQDLNLNPEELKVFLRMVGPRYNHHRREVRIVCKQFPNRIENKRFAVLTLEKLLKEARNIAATCIEYEE
mmetsp:Transcript_13516/g.20305  ORF Transcript_13516/g.20305 Transcript_13516/m.20305 type:complete len:172 (+) Transcript_13516:173-688(+)